MKITLIAQGGAGWAGGAEYIRNLARAIRAASPESRVSLIAGAQDAAAWEPHSALFERIEHVRKNRGWLDRLRPANRELCAALRRLDGDFAYPFTYDNGYNVGASFPLGLPGRWAGWVPDFQHRHLPELFTEKEIARRERGITALTAEAQQIVFSSESAAADFRAFFPTAKNAAPVLTFATFPQAEWYQPFIAEPLDWLPPRYFVVCNQFWSHKNHATVFKALEILAARGVRPMIVCTGALGDFRQPEHTERLLQQMHRAGVGAQVMLLGLVSRRLQIEIIRRSLAVVQPSLFEGWSTVVEDARVLGKATLLSDLAVHKEQNPPGALFFPGTDADSLAALLAHAWENLPVGPNLQAEATAQETATARIAEVGREFLRIAKS